jgi:LemA protein
MADLRIPEDKASEVFELASWLYQQQGQPQSQQTAIADIPPQYIQQALNRLQAREEEARELAQRARLHGQCVGWAGLVACGLLLSWLGLTYSRLRAADRAVDLAWAQLEGTLQQRALLAAQAVALSDQAATAPAWAAPLAAAQQRYETAPSPSAKVTTAAALDQQLQRLSDQLAEPALAAELAQLRVDLSRTDAPLTLRQTHYNRAADRYNHITQAFPAVLVARRLGFVPQPRLELESPTASLAAPD